MGNKSWLHPLTGVLFILLAIASIVVMGDEPPDGTEESIQEVVDFYVDNEDEIFMSSILQGLAAAAFVFYGGYLFKRLRASGADATAAVVLAGSAIFAVGLAIDASVAISLTELTNGDEAEAPGAVQALNVFWHNDFVPFAVGIMTFLWGMAFAIIRHGALPKWMGWVTIIGALCALSPAFFVGLAIAVLLVLVSSIMFSREESSKGSAAAPAA